MAKKSQSILEEILDATGIKGQKEGESRNDFIARLAEALDKLSESDYNDLSSAARKWADSAVVAASNDDYSDVETLEGMITKKRKPEPEPESEDEPAPAPRKRAAPAEDDDPPPRRRKAEAEEEEAPAPRRKRAASAEEEDEPAPAPRKRAAAAEDDDEPPRRKRAAAEDDEPPARRRKAAEEEEEAPPAKTKAKANGEDDDDDSDGRKGRKGKRPGHSNLFRKDVVDYWGNKDMDAMIALGKKKNYSLEETVMKAIYNQTAAVLKYLEENNWLKLD